MSESVVARLRECIEYHALGLHPNYGPPSTLTHIECDTLSALLDIVEEMAAVEPYEPAIGERHELECLFCGELGDRLPNTQTTVSHAPNCPYIRAR